MLQPTFAVVTPPDSDGGRLSMPFFLHPRPDVTLSHDKGDPVTAGRFLDRRLREIGVS